MIVGSSVLLLLASLNAIVGFDILYKVLQERTPTRHVYTYQDSDYPLIPPGLTYAAPHLVSATLHESSRYTLLNAERVTGNGSSIWDTLYSAHNGNGHYYTGPHQNRMITRGYHATHCIRIIIMALDAPDHRGSPGEHFQHCLFYLREAFLCAADQTLEEGDFMKRNYTLDRVGETRTCRDWTYMDEWLEGEFQAWLARNGLSLGGDDHTRT